MRSIRASRNYLTKGLRTKDSVCEKPKTAKVTKVVFIVSGDRNSPMGYRARAFAVRLTNRYDIHIAYREGNKIIALVRFLRKLSRNQPRLVYVFDISYSAVLAAFLHRFAYRTKVIIETGDEIYE